MQDMICILEKQVDRIYGITSPSGFYSDAGKILETPWG